MGLFGNLFKKKEVLPPFDLGRLKSDMHSHLIPGIDDGAQNMDQTIAMLAKFESLGYKKVVTTPHIMTDSFPNTRETILTGLEEVRKEIKKVGIEIEIEAAAEYDMLRQAGRKCYFIFTIREAVTMNKMPWHIECFRQFL